MFDNKEIDPTFLVSIQYIELSILLLDSFRCCLGRKTYAVSDCVEHLTKYWEIIPKPWRLKIKKDICEAIDKDQAGMGMDVVEWQKILNL